MADMKVFICIIVGTVAGIFFLKKQRRNYFGLGYYAKGRGESKHADEEEEEGEEEESGRANMGIQSIGDMGPSGSGSICLTDPDVLDCPICLELLISPVYQCNNGHVACSSCCNKLGNKCPSCSMPIGYNRCRAIEKVIESVKLPCLNIKYGCNESVSYNNRQDHEKMCIYAQCSCPISKCDFIGSSKKLFRHFSIKHPNSAKRFKYNCLFPIDLGVGQRYLILQEQTDDRIVILNNEAEPLGIVLSVICVGPSPTKRECAYYLTARKEDSSVRLQSFAESVPQWAERCPSKKFLLVPSDFIGSSGKLKLELCIWEA